MSWLTKKTGLEEFLKKDEDFYKMLHDQASKAREGIEALQKFVSEPSPTNAKRVKEIEEEADEYRKSLIEKLHQSFAPPMDREDIFALSRAVDDIVDYADTTVDEMEIYEVSPDDHLREMVDILRKAAREIEDAIKIIKDYPRIAREHAVQAKFYENTMEKAYHSALANLFKKNGHCRHAEDEGDLQTPQQCRRSRRPSCQHHLQHHHEGHLIFTNPNSKIHILMNGQFQSGGFFAFGFLD